MSAIRTTPLTLAYLALAAALAAIAGCSVPKAADFKPSKVFSLKSTWPWRDKEEPRKGTPIRIVGTWTDTVLHKPGQTPQRGFGGRLAFYDRDSSKPILVDGQLVVYAFEESDRDLLDNKPTRRYVFPAEQLSIHMSVSEIGPSYSFWLPWDEAGGPKTEISLICRFEPKGGAVIMSEQTRQLLPGSMPAGSGLVKQPLRLPEGVPARPALPTLESLQNSRRLEESGVRQASFQSTADPHVGAHVHHVDTTTIVPERRMSVTSITLPRNLQLHGGATAGATESSRGATAPAAPVMTPMPVQQQSAPAPPPAKTPSTSVSPATSNGANWQNGADTKMQAGAGFESWPIARPQFISTQPTTWQPMSIQSPTAGAR